MVIKSAIVPFLCFALVVVPKTRSSATSKREQALEEVNACLRMKEVSSTACRKLNQSINTLVEAYNSGDKSVLPTLFNFTYLTDFYDEALLSDPVGFLRAMNDLSEEDQNAVAAGIAGGTFRPLGNARFEAVRASLKKVLESSPASTVAETCLKALETNNASLFMKYFPPQTLTSRASDFEIYSYSRDLFALGEKPLWSPELSHGVVYRLTNLGTFTGPQTITLKMAGNGSWIIRSKVLNESHDTILVDKSGDVAPVQFAKFLDLLQQADFWHMSVEVPSSGLRTDGATWILEGLQDGSYHIVVRRCAGGGRQSSESLAFSETVRFLIDIAGQRQRSGGG